MSTVEVVTVVQRTPTLELKLRCQKVKTVKQLGCNPFSPRASMLRVSYNEAVICQTVKGPLSICKNTVVNVCVVALMWMRSHSRINRSDTKKLPRQSGSRPICPNVAPSRLCNRFIGLKRSILLSSFTLRVFNQCTREKGNALRRGNESEF